MRKMQNSLAFDANTKLHSSLAVLTFSAKLATNMVTWSFLPFPVNVIQNLSVVVMPPITPCNLQSSATQLGKSVRENRATIQR